MMKTTKTAISHYMKIPPVPLFQSGVGGNLMLRCARKGMGFSVKFVPSPSGSGLG
jgi:hypothetical protein